MAIPQNKSDSGLPIATGALLLVMLGAYALSIGRVDDVNVESDALLAEAAEYLLEKPYLDVHPRLEAFVGAETIEKKRSHFQTSQNRRGASATPSGLRDRRQKILDEKIARVTQALGALPDRVWGLRPNEASAPSFVTHAFVHTQFLHFAANVLIFCWLGMMLERVWGSAKLLLFSLCAAMVSGGTFVLTNRELDVALIGYSGVAAATFGAYLVNAGNAGRGLNYVFTLVVTGALVILPSLFGQSLGQGGAIAPLVTGVAFGPSGWSLLGGAIFGMVAAPAIWLATLDSERAAPGLTKRDVAAKGLLGRAAKAAANDQKLKSAELIKIAILKNPTDRKVALTLWRAACTVGLEKNASGSLLTAIRDELRCGEQDSATKHWLELLEANPDVQAESGLLLRLAPLLQEQELSVEAVRTLECALRVTDPARAAEVASSVALAARNLEPDLARRATQKALEVDYLDPDRRSALEELMAGLPATAANPQPAPEQSSDVGGSDVGGSDVGNFDAVEIPESEESATGSAVESRVQPESSTPDEEPSDEMWDLEDLMGSAQEQGSARSSRSEETQCAEGAASVAGIDAFDLPDDIDDLSSVLQSDAWSATLSADPAAKDAAPIPFAAENPELRLDVSDAIPTGITTECLHIEVEGRGKLSIDLGEIDAIATGLVSGLAKSPVVVIDLALNWSAGRREPLRIARLRSDQFDARQIMQVEVSADDALREMLKHLLAVATPVTLPDPMSVGGMPFLEFASLDEYERVVLARQEGEELELL